MGHFEAAQNLIDEPSNPHFVKSVSTFGSPRRLVADVGKMGIVGGERFELPANSLSNSTCGAQNVQTRTSPHHRAAEVLNRLADVSARLKANDLAAILASAANAARHAMPS
ncbi:MAG: hypothetical protein KDB03_01620 [Planctomycetales bacterium]|nr:hypothetical protein [Planctomycetales bacterium]